MTVSVIILNYKSQGHLRQCLRSLRGNHLPFNLQVIVVDNGSRDNSAEVTTREYPGATYIALPKNIGYSAGNNAGLRVATGEMIMILNPDVAVFPEAMVKLVDYLQANPQVGMVAPRLINPDGSTQLSGALFPSFWMPLWRRSSLGRLPGPREQLTKYFIRGWDRASTRPVGWVLGACILFTRAAYDRVGPLDERYFLYYDDIDYCRRFWEHGLEVHYLATAEMVHYHSRGSAVNPGLTGIFSYTTRIHIRSWLAYTRKLFRRPKPPYSM